MTCFEPERLLAALPMLRIRPPTSITPKGFLKWRWPMIPPYLGFTPVERVQNWQIGRWLIAANCIAVPCYCSICGSADRVGLHSEDYYSITRSPALCGRCHMALHRRFSRPATWADVIQDRVRTGSEWFALIPSTPYDLAGYLRNTRGEHLRDMLADAALLNCPGVADRLPRNLHSPDESGPVDQAQPDLFSDR